MKIGHKIDANGFLLEDVIDGSGVEPDVTALCPDGFFKPKWDGTQWVEGLTQVEIDAIKNETTQPSTDERLTALENAFLSSIGL